MTPQEPADLGHLRRARDLMVRDVAEPLDVAAMARAALMSPSHSSRAFRAAYGETPYSYLMTRHSYLMTRRTERAMALLRQGVTDARFAVGLHLARVVQLAVDRRPDAVPGLGSGPLPARGTAGVREAGRHSAPAQPQHRLAPSRM